MSTRRVVVAGAVLGLLGAVLAGLSPAPAELVAVLSDPQAAADTAGADAVVAAACAALAWLVWSWGVLGLALTATSAIPGALGALADPVLRVLLPAGARRAAAVALGLGLGMGAPGLAGASALSVSTAPAPDWPATAALAGGPTEPAPEWPQPAPPGGHVVVRGDCLWDIASARLAAGAGRTPTDREVAAAVQAWWTANADVIGADPDVLLPGQVLRAPGAR